MSLKHNIALAAAALLLPITGLAATSSAQYLLDSQNNVYVKSADNTVKQVTDKNGNAIKASFVTSGSSSTVGSSIAGTASQSTTGGLCQWRCISKTEVEACKLITGQVAKNYCKNYNSKTGAISPVTVKF